MNLLLQKKEKKYFNLKYCRKKKISSVNGVSMFYLNIPSRPSSSLERNRNYYADDFMFSGDSTQSQFYLFV